jgi:hypothetical protein
LLEVPSNDDASDALSICQQNCAMEDSPGLLLGLFISKVKIYVPKNSVETTFTFETAYYLLQGDASINQMLINSMLDSYYIPNYHVN